MEFNFEIKPPGSKNSLAPSRQGDDIYVINGKDASTRAGASLRNFATVVDSMGRASAIVSIQEILTGISFIGLATLTPNNFLWKNIS